MRSECDKHDRRVNTRPELAAIDNLPQYAVVGTLEDLRASLSVLAARLPAFFGPPFDYRPYASVHLNAFGESAGRKQRHERLNASRNSNLLCDLVIERKVAKRAGDLRLHKRVVQVVF